MAGDMGGERATGAVNVRRRPVMSHDRKLGGGDGGWWYPAQGAGLADAGYEDR